MDTETPTTDTILTTIEIAELRAQVANLTRALTGALDRLITANATLDELVTAMRALKASLA